MIGCGFVARRDAFPIPADTLTEDHDLTLAVQAGPRSARAADVTELHQRGFRVVLDGEERPLAEVVGDGPVELRTTADARFEAGAAMGTEDPPRLPAYLGQVERWVGGGLENLLKRVLDPERRRTVTPNVRFAVLGAQLENLLGVLLLLGLARDTGRGLAVGRGGRRRAGHGGVAGVRRRRHGRAGVRGGLVPGPGPGAPAARGAGAGRATGRSWASCRSCSCDRSTRWPT